MHLRKFLLFLLIFSLTTLVFAKADTTVPIIAVAQFSSTGIDAAEAASLANAFRSELMKSGMYDIMERQQMESILKEQGFQQSGACDEAQCAIEMGKLLSVKFIAMGNIGKVGSTYTVNVRMVDVATGRILKDVTQNHRGETDQLLTDVIPEIANKLTDGGKSKPVEPGKKSKAPVIIGVTSGVVMVAAIVVTYFLLSEKKTSNNSANVDASW